MELSLAFSSAIPLILVSKSTIFASNSPLAPYDLAYDLASLASASPRLYLNY